MTGIKMNQTCKGSWSLGTDCGECERCLKVEHATYVIPAYAIPDYIKIAEEALSEKVFFNDDIQILQARLIASYRGHMGLLRDKLKRLEREKRVDK